MKLFPFSRYKVYGNSMLPTLKPDQEVLTFNWAYIFFKPKVGDIVIMQSVKCRVKGEIIKRVQRLEGNKLYLMGDNKEESTDSRSFGPVSKQEIVGKVIYMR